MGDEMASEQEAEELKAKNKDTPDEIDLDDLESDEETGAGPKKTKNAKRLEARHTLMSSVMRLDHGYEHTDLFMKRCVEFELDERFFEDRRTGIVMSEMQLSALLRCIFALLATPVSMSIRDDTVEFM